MKINFISHLDPNIHHGGGEQITKAILDQGIKRNHTITYVFQDPYQNNYSIEANINILWDVFNCPERNNPFSNNFINNIINSTIPYVYGTGGYEDLCMLGTLPCNGITDGFICNVDYNHNTFKHGGINRPHPKTCHVYYRKNILQKAKLCIFFSELHKDTTEKLVGSINNIIIKPPIHNLYNYTNWNTKRDIKYLSYGGHLEYKGFYNIKESFPNESPLFIGNGDPSLVYQYNYGTHIGKIDQNKMPELLNRTQNFIHMPRWPEPYGMTTLQALLCGCNIIENEFSSISKQKNITEYLQEVLLHQDCKPFWNTIEALIK